MPPYWKARRPWGRGCLVPRGPFCHALEKSVPIPVADQKDRGLWERDCRPGPWVTRSHAQSSTSRHKISSPRHMGKRNGEPLNSALLVSPFLSFVLNS